MSNELSITERLTFSASTADGDLDFSHEEFEERVGTGFSEHGVRENYDDSGDLESVDVIYEAMEPGPPERRNGVRITEDFLDKVAGKDYSNRPPHLKDHNSNDTFSRIGEVRETWFSERLEKLMLMVRTPNIEGSSNHQEAIARYTHDPPAIRDGSLGFGQNYKAVRNDDGEPEMRDGKFREFSTVNFPGGYDEGGVNTAFAEAIEKFDSHSNSGDSQSYKFSTGDWVQRDWSGGNVYGKVRSRTKDSFTVDGNEVSGDEGEPVYKMEEYDDGFTGQMVAAAQSSLSSWNGPQDNMSESDAYLEMTFSGHEDELDEVYSDWNSEVNMTASELKRWSDHPCANEGSQNPSDVRKRNLNLLQTSKSDWGSKEVKAAKRTISFIERMNSDKNKPESPKEGGKGTCPSKWAISLLNWAYNPFSSLPDGDPNPEESAEHVSVIEFSPKFDDPADDTDKSGENSAAEISVEKTTFNF